MPVQHSKFIENKDDYMFYFWIPKKEMLPSGYYGIIELEDNKVKNEKNIYKGISISSLGICMILICLSRMLPKIRRKDAINKTLLKRILNEIRNYIFDYRSIPFKFTFLIVTLIVLGIVLFYLLMFNPFMYSEYMPFVSIILYGVLILAVIGRCIYFTIKLQRIIDSSESISSNFDKMKYSEKNLKKLNDGIEKMREGFKEALKEQMKSERMKAELVTNISHDLKTPLTTIINYTDILLNKDISDEEKIDYLKVLNSKGLKLKLLIEDLFEISKIVSGKEEIIKTKVNLLELINQSIGELSSNIEESDIDFYVNSNNSDIILNLDGKKISRVFENLISNITKYSLTGTRAYIDIFDKEDSVNITFKNISSERLNINVNEIFNRFTRGDSSRNSKVEGSGLGLAIAKSIIDLHSGKIKANIDGDLFKIEINLPK